MQYLDKQDIEVLHQILTERAEQEGEPIPSLARAKQGEIDALIHTPKHQFFGVAAYPTLSEKAAIIFYTINKKQIFLNGNKRMSTLCLLVFLGINEKELDVAPDELTAKALWLANTSSLDFPQIKTELVGWITLHLSDRS